MLTETIWLQRPRPDVPWGFRLQGGADYNQPLTVYRVSPGSIASTGLTTGDVIMKIGDMDTQTLTFNQSQDAIKQSGNLLQFQIGKQFDGNGPSVTIPPSNQNYSTKLDEQLAQGTGNSYYEPQSPSSYGGQPFSPTGSNQPQYTHQTSHPGAPDYQNGTPASPQSGITSPYGSAPHYGSSPNTYSPAGQSYPEQYAAPDHHRHTGPPGGPHVQSPSAVVPDAVLNMAAKGGPDNKPFTYVPDANALKEHRDKVRRRAGSNMPRYQQMMNMPDFSEPPTMPTSPQSGTFSPVLGSPEGNVVPNQYNSPINAYSDNNVAHDTGRQKNVHTPGGKKSDADITQSETYKMIHGIDQPVAKPAPPLNRTHSSEGHHRINRQPSRDDEVHFSGLPGRSSRSNIPPRAVQAPQPPVNIGGGEVDETPILFRDGDSGDFNEDTIRYTGNKIPSRSFAMLQKMTGSDNVPIPQTLDRRRRRPRDRSRQRSVPPEYRSQNSTQQPTNGHEPVNRPANRVPVNRTIPTPDPEPEEPPRNFDEKAFLAGKVGIFGDAPKDNPSWKQKKEEPQEPEWKTLVRKRRESKDGCFNESMVINLKPCDPGNQENSTPEWKRMVDQKRSQVPFDEHAILSKRQPNGLEPITEPEWVEKRKSMNFDELENIPKSPSSNSKEPEWAEKSKQLLESFDEAKLEKNKTESVQESPPDTEWAEKRKSMIGKFDESQVLLNRSNSVADSLPDPEWEEKRKAIVGNFDESQLLQNRNNSVFESTPDPEWETKRKAIVENWLNESQSFLESKASEARQEGASQNGVSNDEPEEEKPFDERAYLMGRVPLVKGGEPDLTPLPKTRRRRTTSRPCKPELQKPYDEQSFLAGRLNVLGGSTPNLSRPPRAPRESQRQQAPWHREEDDRGAMTDDEFDERTFLGGGYAPRLASVERELPPKHDKPKRYRDRAPWERANFNYDEEYGPESDAEFDESAYLRGRIAVRESKSRELLPQGQESFKKVRSRTFNRLTRSMSRDTSPAPEGGEATEQPSNPRWRRTQSEDRFLDGNESDEPTTPYNDMTYVGKKIPSKTFGRLQNDIAKNSKVAKDPLERLRRPKNSGPLEVLDLDAAMEKLNIGPTDNPMEYLDILKQTCQGNRKPVEDVTDF